MNHIYGEDFVDAKAYLFDCIGTTALEGQIYRFDDEMILLWKPGATPTPKTPTPTGPINSRARPVPHYRAGYDRKSARRDL